MHQMTHTYLIKNKHLVECSINLAQISFYFIIYKCIPFKIELSQLISILFNNFIFIAGASCYLINSYQVCPLKK